MTKYYPARSELAVSNKVRTLPRLLLNSSLAALMEDEIFDSVTWDTPSPGGYDAIIDEGHKKAESSTGPGYRQEGGQIQTASDEPKWEGYLEVEVKDPIRELEGTKDTYISYLVCGQVRSGCKFALVFAFL